MKRPLILLCILAVAAVFVPAAADQDPQQFVARYEPQAPGTVRNLTYFFGPYTIPPGQDSNRITVDVPLQTGFMLAVAPDLIDATTGEEVGERVGHIHHAHWFRVTTEEGQEYYSDGLSWVFGTGEEKTQGSLDDRARANPVGPRYGIFVNGTTPQSMIYMIHNKTAQPLVTYVTLTVRFMYGTAEEITAADPKHPMHPLTGTLWGQTADATVKYPVLQRSYTASANGTAIASAGHLHPGGKEVVLTNLGPSGKCSADLDHDGWPGTTLLHSRKFDRIPQAWPYAEEYQLGATKFGWRAPIHKGDVLKQFGVYDVDNPKTKGIDTIDGLPHAWYQAMSYTGLYVDRAQAPGTSNSCAASNFKPRLIGPDTVAYQAKGIDPTRFRRGVTEGVVNHPWGPEAAEPVCGLSGAGPRYAKSCARPATAREPGMATDNVHISAFYYLPGDLNMSGQAGAPPLVTKGTQLTFVNEDAAANIRHSVTSCLAPCNGEYVGNYPLPDGSFDSGKLGNLDPIDGGLTGADTVPVWTLDTSTLKPGLYTYFCRIHPFMRGAFQLTK